MVFLKDFWNEFACVDEAESSSSRIMTFFPFDALWQNGIILDWIVSIFPSIAHGMNRMSFSLDELARINAKVVLPIPGPPIKQQLWMSSASIHDVNFFFNCASRQKCSNVLGLYLLTQSMSSTSMGVWLSLLLSNISSSKSIILLFHALFNPIIQELRQDRCDIFSVRCLKATRM